MLIAVLLVALALGGASASAQDLERELLYFQREDVLGTSLKTGVAAAGVSAAAAVDEAVRAEIARAASVVSTWDPESELSRTLRATGPVKVSDELFALLAAAERWRAATGGAFHPATGGLADLWRKAAETGGEPKPEELAAEVARLQAPPCARLLGLLG